MRRAPEAPSATKARPSSTLACQSVQRTLFSKGLGFRVYGLEIWGFPKIRGTFWGPYQKDYWYFGSLFGFPYLGKLPYVGIYRM